MSEVNKNLSNPFANVLFGGGSHKGSKESLLQGDLIQGDKDLYKDVTGGFGSFNNPFLTTAGLGALGRHGGRRAGKHLAKPDSLKSFLATRKLKGKFKSLGLLAGLGTGVGMHHMANKGVEGKLDVLRELQQQPQEESGFMARLKELFKRD